MPRPLAGCQFHFSICQVQPFITSRALALVQCTSTNDWCAILPAHGLTSALLEVDRNQDTASYLVRTYNDYRFNHDAGEVIFAITKPIPCSLAWKHAHPSDKYPWTSA
ncbi:hypothetical protein BDZ85DRAFT_33403 [Elsinoe ampelina]|uniref:Uncharacterized protein n=1 Tax=Elsinoe ampelina TaxID=302913 RepID=A0A6A6G397_9PEZI|nr:hypothetical protein BDZ85DRAFT_33403 [Elsinoe ampelina]